MVAILCTLLVLASQGHSCLHTVGIELGRVPPLRLRASKDYEEQIAQEVEEGSDEEHNAPLVHGAFFLGGEGGEGLVHSQEKRRCLVTYHIGYDETNDQGCHGAHDIGSSIGDAHQGAGIVWRQINVIHLEAQVGGSTDAHGQSEQHYS